MLAARGRRTPKNKLFGDSISLWNAGSATLKNVKTHRSVISGNERFLKVPLERVIYLAAEVELSFSARLSDCGMLLMNHRRETSSETSITNYTIESGALLIYALYLVTPNMAEVHAQQF